MKIDQTTTKGVDEQAAALPLPAALKVSRQSLIADLGGEGPQPATSSTVPLLNRLELRIHRVKCVTETNEWGDDEIDLGGTIVDETGDTEKIANFRVSSSFDDGEVKTYAPPRTFATFDLTEGTLFPKSYYVTLVLAEVDFGGISALLDKLLNK
ncbi:MAG TPA: hypothetical protein VM942_04675, partial [Acidimicrobiales bacterium]|nr:hypothetical protein [Acidimicrobiales bacterium]